MLIIIDILNCSTFNHHEYSWLLTDNERLFQQNYKEMEDKVSAIFSTFEGELKGKYHPLTGMDKATQQQLIDDHFLFKEGDR